MSDNPIQGTPEREERIRERAYLLWEADGRPEGRSDEYWDRARELIAMEEHAQAALLPNPMTQDEPVPGVTVEEAEVAQNYGDFPDRFTDQGERQQVPAPKRGRRETKVQGATSGRGKGR